VESQFEEGRGRLRPDDYVIDAATEARLEAVLDRVNEELTPAVEQDEEQVPEEALSVIEAWVSLASYATSRTYGPESPWVRGWAGWSGSVARRLRDICGLLERKLEEAARGLGADGCSIGMQFPWGVAVGLSWSTRRDGDEAVRAPTKNQRDALNRLKRGMDRIDRGHGL
jgi:hypothetical protein